MTRRRGGGTIRFAKQSCRLEDIRALTYERLKNRMALVPAATRFAAAHLGTGPKLLRFSGKVLEIHSD